MILCGFLVGRSVDQGSIDKPDPKIGEFRGYLWVDLPSLILFFFTMEWAWEP